ncbi:hypothetical protein FNV43_RR06927 [Rhamnella rubrinervis]|uniref:CRC domain-containing protein n=1 Tax=Rhamnella rubrinervis TaxID=2594499 RepID=A0A8K0HFJ8_9ROSA|nr:hypothetical protein FNV43_RR06927 [Rhamnella rubrinervis]
MDRSPEPSRIAQKSSSSSPTVQESPFFNYASNLSPIKSSKGAVQYAQRSMDTTLPIPPPVFTSPRMDLQRGNSLLGRDEKFESGFNVYKQGDTLTNVVRIPSFEKEIQSDTHSGSVDEYLTEPMGLEDSMNSADIGFTATKETITKVVSLDGNTENQAITLTDQAAENLPSGSVDWRDNKKVKENFPEFMSEKDESDINEDLLSGALNCEQHATQGSTLHHHGIRRHLQFEAALAYEETTSYNGNNLCSLTHDNANVRSPASLTNLKSLVSFQYETEASSNQQAVNLFQSIPQQFSSYPFELLTSTQNCGNRVMSNPKPRGIGLHLNSIGISDVYASERLNNDQPGSQAITETSSTSHSTDHVNPLGHPLHLALIEQKTTPCDGSMYASQDTDKVEELNQLSPKRRRKRSTYMVEGCKRCNCKRSKCLKLYCECFAAGVYCVDSCACENCYNKPEFEDTVLDTRQQIESRNPLAFAPKVVKHADSPVNVTEEGNWSTPTSARHKRGCNCKKSKCLKKYCECYQAKVGCSDGCRCEGCQNSFGIKAVAETIYKRAEKWDSFTNEKMDALKSGNADQVSRTWEPLVDITNITPLPHPSSGAWTPSSSSTRDNSKVSGAQLYPGSRFQSSAPSSFHWNCSPDSLIEQLCENKTSHSLSSNNSFYDLIDDDTPQMLKENSTPNRAVKASSPNQKRDSPPQFPSQGLTSDSPRGLRGGRRFILQSMPSFPPLTPYTKYKDRYNLD